MQIRIRKNTISLLRSVYDKEIGRGRTVFVGSLPVSAESIPSEIDTKLKDHERLQLQRELEKIHSVREIQLEELAGRLLPVNLKRAVRWYDRQISTDELAELARECREIWTEVLAAMVRAGVGRTRNRRKLAGQ